MGPETVRGLWFGCCVVLDLFIHPSMCAFVLTVGICFVVCFFSFAEALDTVLLMCALSVYCYLLWFSAAMFV